VLATVLIINNLNNKTMLIHELKTWPEYFQTVKTGIKPFEVRKDDRPFQIGDELLLKEFVPKNYYEDQTQDEYYTGNICHRKITYILRGGNFGLEKGYVILGVAPV